MDRAPEKTLTIETAEQHAAQKILRAVSTWLRGKNRVGRAKNEVQILSPTADISQKTKPGVRMDGERKRRKK